MKRKVGLAVAAALLLMLPLVPRLVRAQTAHRGGMEQCAMMGHGGGMMGGMEGMSALPIFLRAANLTADQQAKVKTIMQANRTAMHSQFDQIRAAREQIAAKLFSTGELTAAALSTQTDQIAKAQQQLLQNELSVALQVRAILTPAQLQKVAQFHQQFESLHQQMRALLGPPPGDGPPPPDGPGPDAGPPV